MERYQLLSIDTRVACLSIKACCIISSGMSLSRLTNAEQNIFKLFGVAQIFNKVKCS